MRRLVLAGLVFAGSAWTFVHYAGAWALLLVAAWSAVIATVHGRYPFADRTYLRNWSSYLMLSVIPGALAVAWPAEDRP